MRGINCTCNLRRKRYNKGILAVTKDGLARRFKRVDGR